MNDPNYIPEDREFQAERDMEAEFTDAVEMLKMAQRTNHYTELTELQHKALTQPDIGGFDRVVMEEIKPLEQRIISEFAKL